jgi:hypothetical protein
MNKKYGQFSLAIYLILFMGVGLILTAVAIIYAVDGEGRLELYVQDGPIYRAQHHMPEARFGLNFIISLLWLFAPALVAGAAALFVWIRAFRVLRIMENKGGDIPEDPTERRPQGDNSEEWPPPPS